MNVDSEAIRRMIDEGSPVTHPGVADIYRFDPDRIIRDLSNNREILVRCSGNSLAPLVFFGELVRIEPLLSRAAKATIQPGDIVAALMPEGKFYCHIVHSVNEERRRQYTIVNNRGYVNGVTSRVFGRIVGVLEPETFDETRIETIKTRLGWRMPDLLR
jgi:hypothetical protein